MSDSTQKKTFTLDEAAQELNLSKETIEKLLPKLGATPQGNAPTTLTEDQVNQIVDMLNDPENK